MPHLVNHPAARRMIALLTLIAALSTVATSPALAGSGTLRVYRGIELTGDRNFIRADFRVVDSAPGGHFKLSFAFPFRSNEDPGGEINVLLAQEGADNGSRLLVAESHGLSNNVNGPNCVPGEFYSSCRRGGYDWVRMREYRVVLDRGGHNDDGWLWTLRIVDRKTKESTPLLSLRNSYARLDPNGSLALIEATPNDCGSINSFGANVQKPEVREGTTVSWGDVYRVIDCPGQNPTQTAAVDSGVLKLRIAQ